MIRPHSSAGQPYPLLNLFQKLFDIREGEGHRTVGMFFYLLLLIAALMMIKPVSTALFLTQFGARQLPFAYILTAFFAATLSYGYSVMLKKTALETLMKSTLTGAIFLLLVFWVFIHYQWVQGVFLYLFFVWTGLAALICVSQFWLAAGHFFNLREAKRLFGPIGSGAIIGGIAGGYVTRLLAPALGGDNLILIGAVCLFLCVRIMNVMWKTCGRPDQSVRPDLRSLPPEAEHSTLMQILKSRHLRYLSVILALSVIVARLVDYQFNAIVSSVITDQDHLAAFLGFWMSNLNIIALLVQLFLTRRIIELAGVGSSLFFLPAAVCLGGIVTLIHPALWSAVVLKLSEGGFKNSLNKSSMELLFLPVPLKIKNQAKAFIDVFVDSTAGAIGGVILIFLVFAANISPAQISWILFILVAAWLVLIHHVKTAYIQSFKDKFDQLEDTGTRLAGPIPDNAQVIEKIVQVLTGPDEKDIRKMLQMISAFHSDRLTGCFVRLLGHASPDIAVEALRQLYFSKQIDVSPKARELLKSHHLTLQTEAVRYLFHHAEDQTRSMTSFLENQDHRIRDAALLCLVREARKNRTLKARFAPDRLIQERLDAIPGITDAARARSAKKICIQAISLSDIYPLYSYLYLFMEDPDTEVVTAAIQGAGQTGHPQFIRILLSFLGRKPLLKNTAMTALSHYGTPLLDQLGDHLSNPYLPYNIRKRLPEVIASSGSQKAVDLLSRHLAQTDLGLRYEVIRALNKLRIRSGSLFFDHIRVVPRIRNETKDYMDMLMILYAQKRIESGPLSTKNAADISRAREQLIQGLEVRLDASLERVFRLLGLKYPPVEMYSAYKGICSTDREIRMSAMEFLDNILDGRLKHLVLPVIETARMASDSARHSLEEEIPGEYDSCVALLNSQDDFLKAKTLYLLAFMDDDRYIPHMAALLDSPARNVRDMARFALRKSGRFALGPKKAAQTCPMPLV
jgi:AAA family ATP:ADP antiporter